MKPIRVKAGAVTVSIYYTPRKGVPRWTVTWTTAEGRQRKYFDNLDDRAKPFAQAKARQLLNGETRALNVSDEDVVTLDDCERLLAPLGVPLRQAVTEYATARQRLGETPLAVAVHYYLEHSEVQARQTVAQAVEKLLEAKRQDGRSDRHLKTLQHRLDRFALDHSCHVDELTGPGIEAWLRASQKRCKWTGRTRNHYRTAISNLMNFCRRRRFIPPGWAEMDAVEKAVERDGEVEIFAPEDCQRLLDAAPAELLPFLCLTAFCGFRPSEVERGDWSDLHWNSQEAFIGQGKVRTAGNRIGPLTEPARAFLGPICKKRGPLCTLQDPYKRVAELAREIQLSWIPDGLRHSFVSYRLATTKNIHQVSEEAGTAVSTLRRRYRRPVRQATADAWFAITP